MLIVTCCGKPNPTVDMEVDGVGSIAVAVAGVTLVVSSVVERQSGNVKRVIADRPFIPGRTLLSR